MRLALLTAFLLTACQSELDEGETWADEQTSFEGIMAVLEDGMRPCTVELEPPALLQRVLDACCERGLPRYAATKDASEVDMQLRFERVIQHAPEVLRVRCAITLPTTQYASSFRVTWEQGAWRHQGSTRCEGDHYPSFQP